MCEKKNFSFFFSSLFVCFFFFFFRTLQYFFFFFARTQRTLGINLFIQLFFDCIISNWFCFCFLFLFVFVFFACFSSPKKKGESSSLFDLAFSGYKTNKINKNTFFFLWKESRNQKMNK